MRRSPSLFLALTAAAGTLVLAACSETTTSPTSRLAPKAPAFTIGPTANVGPVQVTFASNGTTQYCATGGYPAIHTYTVPASLGPLSSCGTAFDLMTNLNTSYNPGWDAPISGSSWIGPNATSNEYKTAPGSYVFQTTFNIPAGVTSPVLNDTLMSDNAVAVYLNGHKIEAQVIADCNHVDPCNWNTTNMYVISDANAADFNIGGTNTITVLLVDTPNGGNAGNNYACTTNPQPFGELGFGGTFNVPTSPDHVLANWTTTMTSTTGCENPTGLDFSGNVSWVVPPPPSTTWCSPGFWKNHESLWPQYLNTLYSSIGSWRAPLSKKAPAGDPTLQQVVENPQTYGGPATNSVADYLSNIFFGTPIGSGVESCPSPNDFPTLGN